MKIGYILNTILREFLEESKSSNLWYRWYTTNTKNNDYVWITSSAVYDSFYR